MSKNENGTGETVAPVKDEGLDLPEVGQPTEPQIDMTSVKLWLESNMEQMGRAIGSDVYDLEADRERLDSLDLQIEGLSAERATLAKKIELRDREMAKRKPALEFVKANLEFLEGKGQP